MFDAQGGELSIFTDRDQRSIFLGFEFRKSVFFWVFATVAVFFGSLNKCCIFFELLNKCCILRVSYFQQYFF